MPIPGQIVITIQKDVPSQDAAHALWDLIRDRIADHPDLKVTARFINHLNQD